MFLPVFETYGQSERNIGDAFVWRTGYLIKDGVEFIAAFENGIAID